MDLGRYTVGEINQGISINQAIYKQLFRMATIRSAWFGFINLLMNQR
jgi:hypothetical protein